MLKTQLISMFDLKRFTNQQLTTTVRKSKLFSESSILEVLSLRVTNLDVKVDELEKKKNNLEEEVKEFEEDVVNLQEKVDECVDKIRVGSIKRDKWKIQYARSKTKPQISQRAFRLSHI